MGVGGGSLSPAPSKAGWKETGIYRVLGICPDKVSSAGRGQDSGGSLFSLGSQCFEASRHLI